jgi:hypothetical protein
MDARFSSAGATPTAWAHAVGLLDDAQVYWLSTVRPYGRPHVTPLLDVWLGGALYFCTGPCERKAHNLTGNPHCALTTGRNTLGEGLDLVAEGDAVKGERRRGAPPRRRRLRGQVRRRLALRRPRRRPPRRGRPGAGVFGFAKGEQYSQTRWRFAHR